MLFMVFLDWLSKNTQNYVYVLKKKKKSSIIYNGNI